MKSKLSALGATLVLALVGGVGTAHANLVPVLPPDSGQTQDSSQSQEATNKVEQDASSTAVNTTGVQTNVNGAAPIAPVPLSSTVDGPSDGGDINQSNTSGADSEAQNSNVSSQSVDQDASSTAVNTTLVQANVNAPVRVLSPGDSEVNQSNESRAGSSASNANESDQSIAQSQGSTQRQDSHGGSGDQAQTSTQSQEGTNKVEQNATSTAINTTGNQTNLNGGGGRMLETACGCGGHPSSGDVDQSNRSGARSRAANWNRSSQAIRQTQHGTQRQQAA